jgi:predicted nucleic acid-binding protein
LTRLLKSAAEPSNESANFARESGWNVTGRLCANLLNSATAFNGAFALDVSACPPWCFEDEQTAFSDELLDWAALGSQLHVPSIWPLEIVNALLQAVRRKRLPAERARDFLEQLKALAIRIDQVPTLADLARLYELAGRHQLTSYDAAYLDLAMRTGLPLASLDDAVRKAAIAENVLLVDGLV